MLTKGSKPKTKRLEMKMTSKRGIETKFVNYSNQDDLGGRIF
jgi:hypothetical protein